MKVDMFISACSEFLRFLKLCLRGAPVSKKKVLSQHFFCSHLTVSTMCIRCTSHFYSVSQGASRKVAEASHSKANTQLYLFTLSYGEKYTVN